MSDAATSRVAVLAAMICVLVATAATAATAAAAGVGRAGATASEAAVGEPAAASVPPRALGRELNRAETQLRRRLARLPAHSGIELVRRPDSLILRVPARVLFAPDSATLRRGDPSAAVVLTATAQLLKRRGRLDAQVDAYTDNIGGASFNLGFSEQRAEAVAAALRAAGVPLRRLQAHGGGLQDALASNDTAQGRMENRRLEIVFEAAPPLSLGRVTTPAGG